MATTSRATKGAYFSDTNGGNIVDFQFSPESLEFTEGGRFEDRILTGQYHTDYIWISGQPTKQEIKMWVDRTDESFNNVDKTEDPFSDLVRFPKASIPKYANFDIVNFLKGVKNGITDLTKNGLSKKTDDTANTVDRSVYSVNPAFSQDVTSANRGVFYDVELLSYFIRPKGFKLSSATDTNGIIKITDFPQNRFTPPPKCRFFYGNYWAEGYIQEVDYKLTVMNENLVPLRMEADIIFLTTKWGYLNDLATDNAIDVNNL